jgi:T5orf172 domain
MARRTLDDIFEDDDPFGLLDVKPGKRGGASPELEKDRAVLQQANAFFGEHGRTPDRDAADINEAVLGRKLARVRDGDHAVDLSGEDTSGLLVLQEEPVEPPQPSWRDEVPEDEGIDLSLDDIFGDEEFELDADLVKPSKVTPAAERQMADHRAERRPCRDFKIFEPLFEDIHTAVQRGDRELVPFTKKGGTETLEGDFFIQKGQYAYVAEKGERTMKGGRSDHRLRVIYSNGTENDILMRSFEKGMYDDPTARRVEGRGFGPLDDRWQDDKALVNGVIYVARSKSTQSDIQQDRLILHKIGVTSGDVQRRIADARNDATFLFAPVEIVATFELVGMRRDRGEHILHTFFERARADISVPDRFGKKVRPREWFYVRPDTVSKAVAAIKDGSIVGLEYDVETQSIRKR